MDLQCDPTCSRKTGTWSDISVDDIQCKPFTELQALGALSTWHNLCFLCTCMFPEAGYLIRRPTPHTEHLHFLAKHALCAGITPDEILATPGQGHKSATAL